MLHRPTGNLRPASDRSSLHLIFAFALVYAVGLMIVYIDIRNAPGTLRDIDDRIRELQIRHFLFGGAGWWDLRLPMIAMPDVYVSPWSRLVDAPYIALTRILAPLMGEENALLSSMRILPPLMLGVFSFQVAYICRALGTRHALSGYVAMLVVAVCSYHAVWEFVPGRIDHHNMQLLALMTVLVGLVRWDRAGAVLIGAGTVISVAIALEGVPFIVLAFAGLVLAFLCSVEGARAILKWASGVIAVSSLPLALLLLGPAGSASVQCDAFSAPYIVLLTGYSAILWGSTLLSPKPIRLLLPIMVVAAVLLAVGFFLLFPQCLQGPYWMIDPISKAHWLDRVSQESSILFYLDRGNIDPVRPMVILLAILVGATPIALARRDRGWAGGLILLVVIWAAFIATVFLTRYVRFAFAFVPLVTPLVFQALDPKGSLLSPRGRNLLLVGMLLLLIGQQGLRFWPVQPERYDATDLIGNDKCESGDLAIPSGLPAGRIMAPHLLGSYMVLSLPPGFSVPAIPFHRASPGMKRAFETFLTSDADLRKNALAPFDYVAVCRLPIKADDVPAPLYDALSAGEDWPGLIRLPTGAENPFQLFRIDHAALQ